MLTKISLNAVKPQVIFADKKRTHVKISQYKQNLRIGYFVNTAYP